MEHERDIPLEPFTPAAPMAFARRLPATTAVGGQPAPSTISAARAGDLFDLLVAGATTGGAAALAWIAYNTAFDGRWLLHLPDDPFSLELLGLIFLAFGGFRIVALAYDRSESGGILRRTREIEGRKTRSRGNPDDVRS
ncbi:MAG: hypothetical protein PHZ23_16160 [Acidiphilium sp.]|jgi:hypothetical protein|nr:hypothetical protein [Acidiphilium sp.]